MPIDDKTLFYLLDRIDKPGRYIGNEVNSPFIKKDPYLKMILAFPDIYELGMSNLGMRIIYHIVNDHDDYSCERVFSPWIDLEKLLIDLNIPLFTLENHSFLYECDLMGISMQTELSIINSLNIMKLGRIPMKSRDRDDSKYPLIFAGGQAVSNPEPFADFYDFFFLGEGDNKIIDMLDIIKENHNKDKNEQLKALSILEGIYVPRFYRPVYKNGKFFKIEHDKNVRPFINSFREPEIPENKDMNLMLPNIKIIHNRAVIEIARGCINGCRFCQSGYYGRPYRPKLPSDILDEMNGLLNYKYYESLSLLSLNIEDYPNIEDLISLLMDLTEEKKVNISLPSIRASMLSEKIAKFISIVRKGGFTIAPEAGSQRLRDIINKDLFEDQILSASGFAYENGWDLIKCYFMIGLPFEEYGDIDEIMNLARKISLSGSRYRKRSGRLNIGLSPFVPKAFTPLQWAPFEREEEISNKISYIRKNIKNRKINIKHNSPFMAFIEAILSTGDRRLSSIILNVLHKGERFSNWSDSFNYNIWRGALENEKYPFHNIYTERDYNEPLPYDHINVGISKDFLIEEYKRAKEGKRTEKCFDSHCNDCGLGDLCYKWKSEKYQIPELNYEKKNSKTENKHKLRLIYDKTNMARYIGNMDTLDAVKRMLNIANLPLLYSKGFNPSLLYDTLPPLPLGMEGYNEMLDIYLSYKCELDIDYLNSLLPAGIRLKYYYWLDEYDIAIKSVNSYTIGIRSNLLDFERFRNIIDGLGLEKNIKFNKYREIKDHNCYTVRVFFTREKPFSLRKFYDHIRNCMDGYYIVFRSFAINSKEEK